VNADVLGLDAWRRTPWTDHLEDRLGDGDGSRPGLAAEARVVGEGPRFRALVVHVDDVSSSSRRRSRELGHVLVDALDAQLPSLLPLAQVLLVESTTGTRRASGTHLSMLRGVLQHVRGHGLNHYGMDVTANAVVLPASVVDARARQVLLDLAEHRPLQTTGVVLECDDLSEDASALRSSFVAACL
jgi:hypothetical protein